MPMKQPRNAARLAEMKRVGGRIQNARKDSGLTQADIAKRLGFGTSWLSQVELGQNAIEAIDLYRIAKVTGHAVDYFLDPSYRPQVLVNPRTRADWQAIFPDDEARADLHFDVDRSFSKATTTS